MSGIMSDIKVLAYLMRMHTLQVDQWRMWTKVHMVT